MRGRKRKLLVKASSDAVCLFCQSAEQNEEALGKMLYKSGLTLHYFCMLFSSGLYQRGKREKDGILGFMPADIRRELKRGMRLACQYCRKKGATIGCVVTNCRKTFHFPCGKKAGAMCQFFDEFRSYCPEHRPRQCAGSGASDRLAFYGTALSTCSICMMAVEARASNGTLRSPCCKSAWFHRDCMQKYALSAGRYFFKCPLCNSKELFEAEMLEFGIYIPDQDAAWELEPNAYHELLERYSRCDAPRCLCPQGRQHDGMAGGRWELMLCSWCGSSGSHVGCNGLTRVRKDNICSICAEINNSRQQSSGTVQRGRPPTARRGWAHARRGLGRGQGARVRTSSHDSSFSSGLSAEESCHLSPEVVLCRIQDQQEPHGLYGPCSEDGNDVDVADDGDVNVADDGDSVNVVDDGDDVDVPDDGDDVNSVDDGDSVNVADDVNVAGDGDSVNTSDDVNIADDGDDVNVADMDGNFSSGDSDCSQQEECFDEGQTPECREEAKEAINNSGVGTNPYQPQYRSSETGRNLPEPIKRGPGRPRKHQSGLQEQNSPHSSFTSCTASARYPDELAAKLKAGDDVGIDASSPSETGRNLPEPIKRGPGRPRKHHPGMWEQNSPHSSFPSSTASSSSPEELAAKLKVGDDVSTDAPSLNSDLSIPTALVQGKLLRSGKLANLERKPRRYRKACCNVKSGVSYFDGKAETVSKGSGNNSFAGVIEDGAARHITYQCFVSSVGKNQQSVGDAGVSASISEPPTAPPMASLPQSISPGSFPPTDGIMQTAASTFVPVAVAPLSASSVCLASGDCMQSGTSGCGLASTEQQATSSLSLQAAYGAQVTPLCILIDASRGTLSPVLIPQLANPQYLCPQYLSQGATFSGAADQASRAPPIIRSEVSKSSSCLNHRCTPSSQVDTSSSSHSYQEADPSNPPPFQPSFSQEVSRVCSSSEVSFACSSEEFNPASSSHFPSCLPGVVQAEGPVVTTISVPFSSTEESGLAREAIQTSQHSEDDVRLHGPHEDLWPVNHAGGPVPVSLFAHDSPPTPSDPLTTVCQPDLETVLSSTRKTKPRMSSGTPSTSVSQCSKPQTVLPISRGKIWLGSVNTINKLARPHAHAVVVDSDSDVEDIYCIQHATPTTEKSQERGHISLSRDLSARSTQQMKDKNHGVRSRESSYVSSGSTTTTCTSPSRMPSRPPPRLCGMTVPHLSGNRLGMPLGCPPSVYSAQFPHRLAPRSIIPYRHLGTTSFIDLTDNDCDSVVSKISGQNSALLIESSDSDVELIEQN